MITSKIKYFFQDSLNSDSSGKSPFPWGARHSNASVSEYGMGATISAAPMTTVKMPLSTFATTKLRLSFQRVSQERTQWMLFSGVRYRGSSGQTVKQRGYRSGSGWISGDSKRTLGVLIVFELLEKCLRKDRQSPILFEHKACKSSRCLGCGTT